MNNIFVGNLSFEATKEDVQKLFEQFGSVVNVVIMERKKGKSRGYCFVDMPNEEERNKAIAELEGKEFMWRVLSVSPVIPKVPGAPKKKFKPAKLPKKEWAPPEGESGFEKSRESSKPYRSDEGKKPWIKEGGSKPWFKGQDDAPSAKPWEKREGREGRSSGKPTGNTRYEGRPAGKPWQKEGGSSKPYRRDDRETGNRPAGKSWHKEGGSSKSYGSNDRESTGGKPWQKKASSAPWGNKLNKDFQPKKTYGNPWQKGKSSSFKSKEDSGSSKPWEKHEGKESRPAGAFKMFHKTGKPTSKPKTWAKKGQARS
jgi:RNA recognition motif-containing protein